MLKSLVAAVAAVAFATGAAVPLRPIVVDDHFVANVRATNITQCLAAHCQAQVAACTKDTQCNGGIQCVIACPTPVTTECVDACIDKYMDETMMAVGLCASANKCLPSSAVKKAVA